MLPNEVMRKAMGRLQVLQDDHTETLINNNDVDLPTQRGICRGISLAIEELQKLSSNIYQED